MSSLLLNWQNKRRELKKGRRYWLPLTGIERQKLFGIAAGLAPPPHGWLAKDGGLLANLRVWENCMLALGYAGIVPTREDETRFADLMTQLAIPPSAQAVFAASTVASLDAGQKRMAAAIRTIMSKPSLILAESEWFVRLDPTAKALLLAAFNRECPDATWLVLGTEPPADSWEFSRNWIENGDDATA